MFFWVVFWILTVGTTWAAPSIPAESPHDQDRREEAWRRLDSFQESITHGDFVSLLETLYDPFGGLRPFLRVTETEAVIYQTKEQLKECYRLRFATDSSTRRSVLQPFRLPQEIRSRTGPDKPLDGVRLAIDPGHIGGRWGEVENRAIRYSGHPDKLQEGDLNLITARLLKPRLESLGARVFLTREQTEPVTEARPETLLEKAYERLQERQPNRVKRVARYPREEQFRRLQPLLRQVADFLFYRVEEIRARGQKIREHFQPDLTVVLYINATPSSSRARLIGVNQNIFFVHGSYLKEEAADPDQQPRLLYKLLERGASVEAEAAAAISREFERRTGLGPVPYGNSKTTRLVIPRNRHVVARNLAANREYDGPVVVTEPYFMNHRVTNQRLYAGDYEGMRKFEGQEYPSIFREYAESVRDGLVSLYGPRPFQTENH